MAADDLTREELRLAIGRADRITFAKALSVAEMVIKSRKGSDGDNDGMTGDGTPEERPAGTKLPKIPKVAKVPKVPKPPRPPRRTKPKPGPVKTSVNPKLKVKPPKPPVERTPEQIRRAAVKAKIAELESRREEIARRGVLVYDKASGRSVMSRKKADTVKPLAAIDAEIQRLLAGGDPNPTQVDVTSLPESQFGVDRRIHAELHARQRGRGKRPTYKDIYTDPPGNTEDEKQAFRADMYEALLHRPFTTPGGRTYPSIVSYLRGRARQDSGIRNAEGEEFNAPEDALGAAFAETFDAWMRGEASPSVWGVLAKDVAKERKRLRQEYKKKYPNWSDEKIEKLVMNMTPIRPEGANFDSDFHTAMFARWLLGRYNGNLRSPSRQRKATGRPGKPTKWEREKGATILFDRLDDPNFGPDWVDTNEGAQFVQAYQITPADFARAAIMHAVETGSTHKPQTRQRMVRVLADMIPAGVTLRVPDPSSPFGEYRIEVDPREAIIGEPFKVVVNPGRFNPRTGRIDGVEVRTYDALTYNESVVLMASALLSKSKKVRVTRYVTDQNGRPVIDPTTGKPQRKDVPEITLVYDDIAIAHLLGWADDPASLTDEEKKTITARVRKTRSRAMKSAQERLMAIGSINAAKERLTDVEDYEDRMDEGDFAPVPVRPEFSDDLRSLIDYIAAREGVAIGIDTVIGLRSGELTRADVARDVARMREEEELRRSEGLPTIPLGDAVGSLAPQVYTPEMQQRHEQYKKVKAARTAYNNSVSRYQGSVDRYNRWVDRVNHEKESIKRSAEELEAALSAKPESTSTAIERHKARIEAARRANESAKKRLEELTDNPVKKPVAPKKPKVLEEYESSLVPSSSTPVTPKKGKVVQTVIRPTPEQRRSAKQQEAAAAKAAKEAAALAEKERKRAEKAAAAAAARAISDREAAERKRRRAEQEDRIHLDIARLNGKKHRFVLTKQGEDLYILVIKDTNNLIVREERFEGITHGVGNARNAGLKRIEQIKASGVVPGT